MPLLERAKFLAIFSQNLDEFFQVRVAGLKDQVAAGLTPTTPDGRTAAEQLLDIRDRARGAGRGPSSIFLDQVVPGAGRGRHRLLELGRARRGRPQVPRRGVRGAHLPGAHAARGRSRPSVPVHLRPVAQPRGRSCATRKSGERRFARVKVPLLLPAVRGDARRRAVRAARAGHRRPPRRAVPGHGDREPLRLPGHPQRRPHARGGGGRRPARGGRVRAAPAPLRSGGAPRGR